MYIVIVVLPGEQFNHNMLLVPPAEKLKIYQFHMTDG